MRHLLLVGITVSALLGAACGPGSSRSSGGAVPVVATFSIIADLVQHVGGEHITIQTLVGRGVDTHTFNPTPADGVALTNAQLIFENGAGFEGWLDNLYASTGSEAARVVLSDGLALRAARGHFASGAGAQPDPHVWHDVANAAFMVRSIRDALITADPAHRADYEANAQAYTAQLEALDAWVIEQVAVLPPERRQLVTTHDTFGYFAERYGFEILGTVLPATTEGASPSARELAVLVQALRATGVPAVFVENVSSGSLLNQAADEAGVKIVASLYSDALGAEGSGAETYEDMVRQNVTTIISALSGQG